MHDCNDGFWVFIYKNIGIKREKYRKYRTRKYRNTGKFQKPDCNPNALDPKQIDV